jgi:hypothetical protein
MLRYRTTGEGVPVSAIRRRALLISGLLLASCANVAPAPVERKTGQSVELGAEATAAVGDVIYSEFDYTAVSGAVMLEPVSKAIGLGGSVQVAAGEQLVSASVEGIQAIARPR